MGISLVQNKKSKSVETTIDAYLDKLAKRVARQTIPHLRKPKRVMVTRECFVCKTVFITSGNRKKFCSSKCSASFLKEKYHKNKQTSPTVTKVCKHCKKEFQTFRERQEYCTPECRTKKWRKIISNRYALGLEVEKRNG